MTEIITLGAHDPIPSGKRNVVVLRQLEEDGPGSTAIRIVLTGSPDQVTHPRNPDGTPMSLEDAIAAARMVAESEGVQRVFVVDRTQGDREQDILRHGGDHSIHMQGLTDTDFEEGERGPDMRDLAHPERPA